MFKINKLLSLFLLVGGAVFSLVGDVRAEPQFGGDVSSVMPCTCGDNAGGFYFEVDDPHGDGEGGHGRYVAPPAAARDCPPPADGEETLGMHKENEVACQQRIGYACVTVAVGKEVEIYGTSKTDDCDTGLDGDASGDGKIEMITPDGRTADGGDVDDGGPSGGPSMATRHDVHLATVDGVKADGSGGAIHMETPDHQDYEGTGTTHMETSDHRNYEGNHDQPLTNSGNDSGYSSAGAGRRGDGHGSIGGSVGSGGLQSPVVLGVKDKMKEKAKINIKNENMNRMSRGEKTSMLLALIIFIGAGYFVFRSMSKLIHK